MLATFGLAATAKLTASIATYPHEVIRTRLRDRAMGPPDAAGRPTYKYTTFMQCARRISAEEGWRMLYGGMGIHLARVVPNAAILYLTMEVLLGLDDREL